MKTETDPCTVCGCTEVNLVDGFYYCTECGTQDVNTQETVVEHTFVHDKTVTHARSRKIKIVLKDGLQMSREWLKWHGFNFIVHGLVEEMVTLGASKGFREWVLLIWTRYMNLYLDKDKMGAITDASETVDKGQNKSIFDVEEEDPQINDHQQNDKDQDSSEDDLAIFRTRTKSMMRTTLLAMLYLGLLYDKSSIQFSHLLKFIHEKKLSLKTCEKFLPKEIKISSIPDWRRFKSDTNCHLYTPDARIRKTAWALMVLLDLELPEFPDSRKMVEVFVTELCLPNDFKNLVFSLMLKCPMKKLMLVKNKRKLLHYEAMVMSYVVVALKICFGLDGDYEIKISDAVDKINNEENRLKYHKLGPHLDSTNRLFSFREWSNFLQYRKMMLCKYYLPYADQYNLDIDIEVGLKQMGERPKIKVKLEDELTMEILNKIPSTNNSEVIPYSKFVTTLTPLTSYTKILTTYIQDPELKLLLSEDFSQYSLKYACEDFKLDVDGQNIVSGVSEDNKVIRYLIHVLKEDEVDNDQSMVYIKNCENKNWLKTNPPSKEHITYMDTGDNAIERDKESSDSDHGDDSNLESNLPASKIKPLAEEEEILEEIEEEKENISIFDDPFDIEVKEEPENDDFWRQISEISNVHQDSFDINDEVCTEQADLNLETIDRTQIIKELILHACKKYKIVIPKNFRPTPLHPVISGEKRPRTKTNPGQSAKRPRLDKWAKIEAATFMEKILTAYHESIEKDLLNEASKNWSIYNKLNFHQENESMDVCVDKSDVNDVINQDATFNENVDEPVDSSLLERSVQEIGSEDILPSVNPNFDEKSYDIKQLYIKCRERLQFEEVFEFDDPEIEKVLEKKILESKNNDPSSNDKDLSEENLDSPSDKKDETASNEKKEKKKKIKDFPKLIYNPKAVKKFNFWCRHYAEKLRRHDDLAEVFNAELRNNTSKSFMFVINECASIISCTTYNLYKYVDRLERLL